MAVSQAMEDWERGTCLWFVEDSSAVLTIKDDDVEGPSTDGLGTGANNLFMSVFDKHEKGILLTAQHELGHVYDFLLKLK